MLLELRSERAPESGCPSRPECLTLSKEIKLVYMNNNVRKIRSLSAWVLGGLTSLMICLSALAQYSATSTSPNSPITISAGTPEGATAASLYPSVIDLTGAKIVGTPGSVIEKITVSVNLTHSYTPDVGLLLVAPNGQGVVLMNGAGTGPVTSLTLTFDAVTGQAIVQGQALTAATYAPTDLTAHHNFVNASGPVSSALGSPPVTASCITLQQLAANLNGTTAGPNGQWQLYVQDAAVGSSGSISSWTLNLYTTPVFASVSATSVTLAENGAATTLGFSVQDSSPPPQGGFTVTASGAATSLVTVPATTSGLSGTVTLTPVANVFGGPSTLTLTVSDGTASTSTNVAVTVTHVEQTPAIALSTNSAILAQGQISQGMAVTLSDVDQSNLTVTVTSSNPNVVSPNGVFFSPAGPYTPGSYVANFAIVPEGNAPGGSTAKLTFTVSDGNISGAPQTLAVTVNPVPQQVWANTNVITLSASTPTNPAIVVSNVAGVVAKMTVAVDGLENVDPSTLKIALHSKNTGATLTLLAPSDVASTSRNYAQLVFDDNGTGALPTTHDTPTNAVVLHPSGGNLASFINDSPNDTWTLVVTDGYLGASSEIVGGWLVNLYIAPIVAPVSPATPVVTMPEQGSSTITFTVTDPQNAAIYSTNVQVTTDNPALIGISNQTYTNGNGSAVLTANYADNTSPQFGAGHVIVTATDASGFVGTNTYAVTVTFVNHQPTVGFIPKQVTFNSQPVTTPPFTLSDVDYPSQPLTVSVNSDNPKLLPNSNIIPNLVSNNVSKNSYTYTLTLYPVGTTPGQANVSVTVDDGQGLANSTAVSAFVFFAEGPANPLFANPTPIDVPAGANATTYPSTITVNNLIGAVGTVSVTLFDLSYNQYMSGLSVLLVSPEGGVAHSALLLANIGDGAVGFTNTTLVFEDGQTSLPATGPLATGIFEPTSHGPDPVFPPYPSAANNQVPESSPGATYIVNLTSAFKGLSGTNLNGTWSLYINNTNQLGKGVLLNGWQLSITTTPNVQAPKNLTLAEQPVNTATVNVPVIVGDVEIGGNIGVTATPTPSGIISVNPQVDSSGNWSLNITPQPYQYYSNIVVSILATNAQGAASSNSFDVTVYQVPLAPVLVESAIPNITMSRATLGSTTFHVWDPQNQPLGFSVASTDPKDLGVVSTVTGTPVVETLYGQSVNVYPVTVTVLPNGVFYGGPIAVDVTVSDGTAAKPLTTDFTVTVIEGGPLFANGDSSPVSPILLPIGYPVTSNAVPFPSEINVSGVNGYVTGVEVTLVDLQHQFPSEIDALLVGPDGQTAVVLMAHAGDGIPTPAGGVRLTFDQSSANTLVFGSPLASGTYQPANFAGALTFASPVPAPTLSGFYSTNLNAFYGVQPNGQWSLYFMDDNYGGSGTIDNWMLSLQTSPAIQTIGPVTTLENNAVVVPVNLLSDTPTDFTKLTVTAASKGDEVPTNLVGKLVQSITPTVNTTNPSIWYLAITPAPNLPSSVIAANATVDISVTVHGPNPYTTSFPLTVLYSNVPPVITPSTNNLVLTEDGSGSLNLAFYDVDSTLYGYNLAVYSVSTALLPDLPINSLIPYFSTNVFQPGTTPNSVSITLTPNQYAYGTNLVEFVLYDGNTYVTNPITLSVIHVYQPPIISGLNSSYNTAAATTSQPISFSVSSVEGVSAKNITVTATSLTTSIVPANNVVLTQSSSDPSSYTLVLTPVGTQSGAATISIVATDPTKASSTNTFSLVVAAPPANFVGSGSVQLGTNATGSVSVPFVFNKLTFGTDPSYPVYDVKLELRGFSYSDPANLDMLLVSPDGTAVMLMSGAGGTTPVNNLDLVFDQSGVPMPSSGGATINSGTYQASYYTGGKRALPAPAPQPPYNGALSAFQDKATANGTWTLYVNDLTGQDAGSIAGGAFLTITTRPVITISAPVVTMMENAISNVSYTLSDSTTAPGAFQGFQVSATSSGNKAVLPLGSTNVVVSGPDTNGLGAIKLQPAYLQFGSNVAIALAVTRTADGVTGSSVLTATVVPTNFPPIVYRLLPQTTPATTPIAVEVLVSDIDTPLSSLSISAAPLTPGDANIIPASGLVFKASGSNSITGLSQVSPGLGSAFLDITPNQAASGVATIQLTVTDPETASGYVFTNTVTSNLVVNVTSVPGIPYVTPDFTLPQSVAAGSSTVLTFTVGTPTPTPPPVLLLTNVTANPPGLINNIVVAQASGNNWNVTLPAQAGVQGQATISVQAYDATHKLFGGVYTFTLTVTPTPQHGYTNSTPFVIVDDAPASLYPSTIPVSGLYGTIKDVTVTLYGFQHTYPSDVGVLLVSPPNASGVSQKIVLMNRAGAGYSIYPTNPINLTFDQNAPTPVPQDALIQSGSYQPADYLIAGGAYNFFPPAPANPYELTLNDLIGASPNGTWSLYVQDSVAVDGGNVFGGWSLSITTQPQINGLSNVTIAENGSTTENFSIADDSPSGPSFTFGFSSGNSTLFPQGALSVGPPDKTGTNFVLTITPAHDQSGTNTVTVQATDINGFTATDTITVSVPFSAQPPQVAFVPTNYFTMLAGQTLTVPVSYSDPQSLPLALSVVGSSNTNLLPLTSFMVAGTNLVIRPYGANYGQSVVTVQVQEQGGGGLATQTNLTVNVAAVPNLFGNGGLIDIIDYSQASPYPSAIKVSGIVGNILDTKVTLRNFGHTFPHDVSAVLVAPGGQEIILLSRVAEGDWSGSADITLDTYATTPLPISAPITNGTYAPTSYNSDLVFLAGNPVGPYVTNLTVLNNTPAAGTWNLYVQDDVKQDSGTITNGWTLEFATDAPTIQPVQSQTVAENGSLPVALQVGTYVPGVQVTGIVVTATVSQENPPGLITSGSLVAGAPNTNGMVTLTINPGANLPSAYPGSAPFWPVNSNGTAQINVSVKDATGTNPVTVTSFPLTVTYINQGPSIAGLENTNTAANAPLTFAFTLVDVDTPAVELEAGIQSVSDNTGSAISFSSKGASASIALVPNDVPGTAVITVTNFDPISGLTATGVVTVAVTTPAPPILAPISPITALPGAPVPITLNITPQGTPLSGLVVSYAWTPANDASIVISPSQTTAILTPVAGFIGTLSVTATVNDGVTKVSKTFPITFALPAPPSLGAIAAQQVEAGKSLQVPLAIQVGGIPLGSLTVTATPADPTIVTANVSANASVALTGVKPGSTSVTVAVNDGYNTPVQQTFQVTVFPPQPPIWGPLTNQIVTALNTPVTITLPVTSVETPISNLVFSAIIKTQVVSSVVFTNNGTIVTATFNVVSNAVGTEPVTLNVFDGYSTESAQTEVTVTELPMVQSIGPQTVQENGSLPVPFKVASSVGNPVTKIVVTPSVSVENPPGLVSSGKLTVVGPDANGVVTLTVTPGANLPSAYPGSAPFWPVNSNGTAVVTLTVADGPYLNTNSFPLTVTYVNQAPSIVGLVSTTNTTFNAPITIPFTAADVDTPASELMVGIQSITDNTGSGIFLTSKGNAQLLTLIPFGKAGAASITITNFDPISQMTATQTVTINLIAEVPPTFASVPAVSTAENTPVTVPLDIASTVTPVMNLTFSYELSNSNLISSVFISPYRFAVGSTTASAQVIPANGQSGVCAVTIYVSDGVATVSQSFVVTVVATAPIFAPIADVSTPKNTEVTVPLYVTPTVTPLANLTYSYKVSNSNLISSVVINPERFPVNGVAANAQIFPASNQYGFSVVTISVSDSVTTVSQSFALLVLPTPPSLAPIPEVATVVGAVVNVPLSVVSPDTALTNLTFVGSSTNTALVSGVTFATAGTNVTATVNLVANQTGTANVLIEVSDGYSTSSRTFTLTVAPSAEPLYTSTQTVSSGNSWLGNYWQLNGTGALTGPPTAGNTYALIANGTAFGSSTANTRTRNPAVNGVQTFPGDSLTINTNTELRMKNNGSILNFPGVNGKPGLILNGGVINVGDDGNFPITGVIEVTAQSYLCPGNNGGGGLSTGSPGERSADIQGQLTGSGTLVIFEADARVPQKVSGSSNTFSGQWVVKNGLLQGAGANSLGTNSITIDPQYVLPVPPFSSTAPVVNVGPPAIATNVPQLEVNYNLNSAGTLTLANGGQFKLHENVCFTAVTIDGTALPAGTYFYNELYEQFPANFTTGGSGSITVQPYGTPPTIVTLMPTLVGKVLKITFTGVPNASYIVLGSSNLKTWVQVGSPITTDSNGNAEYDATVSGSGEEYFRVQQQ